MPCAPRPTRKPSEPPTATTNSAVSTEPTTLRGSSRPDASSDDVPTGPQPPPPTASSAPPTRPSGARNRALGRGPNCQPARRQEPEGDERAERDQQDRDDGHGDVGVEVDQQRRAGEGTDEAGCGEYADGAPVGVAQRVVGDTGDQRGAELGEVDRGRGSGRGDPGRDEQRRGRDAVPHAERAVDELRGQADQGQQNQSSHRASPHGISLSPVTVPTLWTILWISAPDEIPVTPPGARVVQALRGRDLLPTMKLLTGRTGQ